MARSKFELRVMKDLMDRGEDFEYEAESFEFIDTRTYVPDITLPNGVIVECKGYLKPDDRKKMLLVKQQYPEKDIRLLFMRASETISRRKKSMTYGEWATKHGFVWAEGTIPEEWLA